MHMLLRKSLHTIKARLSIGNEHDTGLGINEMNISKPEILI